MDMIQPVIWFTGLSASGKTTLCSAVEEALRQRGIAVATLDGDVVRKSISSDLGFSAEDRAENLRRMSSLAEELVRSGTVVLVAAISPSAAVRAEIRARHKRFLEVFVNAPLSVCEQRDPKGLYKRARAGQVSEFTGISSPYEAPERPDVECRTDLETTQTSCAKVLRAFDALCGRGSAFLRRASA